MTNHLSAMHGRLTKRILDQNNALAETARQLSQVAFRSMVAEIHNGDFLYNPVGRDVALNCRVIDPSDLYHPSVVSGCRPLNIPLGTIAWAQMPDLLPNIGIIVPNVPAETLKTPLLSLVSQHHLVPFGKLLFLIESLNIAPFLSRYGLCAHHCDVASSGNSFAQLMRRYDLKEIRNLVDGRRR